jgi:hypothetical protein
MTLLELFCDVDDFCQAWTAALPPTLPRRTGQRVRQSRLSANEIMTIVIHFHQSGYRDFKDDYTKEAQGHLRDEFPGAVRYSRFVTLMHRVVLLLWAHA